MKTQKVTLKIEVEVLDIESAAILLSQMQSALYEGAESGLLRALDGDEVNWYTTREEVVI